MASETRSQTHTLKGESRSLIVTLRTNYFQFRSIASYFFSSYRLQSSVIAVVAVECDWLDKCGDSFLLTTNKTNKHSST